VAIPLAPLVETAALRDGDRDGDGDGLDVLRQHKSKSRSLSRTQAFDGAAPV
jgi:hypothetical protein